MRAFFAGLVAFMALDGLWLGVVMKQFYRTALGPIARTNPDGSLAPIWAVALPVYVLLALGQVWFVLPKTAGGSTANAAMWGAAFGVITYGVYDLTNWSTLKSYGPALALTDIAWGAVACAVVAVILRAITARA